MSKRSWCRANGISERMLYYWQHRIWLTETPGNQLPEKQELAVNSSRSVPDSSFVELDIRPDPGAAVLSGSQTTGAGIVLQCCDCRIYVADGVSEAALSSVLRAVRNA